MMAADNQKALGRRIVNIQKEIVKRFGHADWTSVALLTGRADVIEGHPRLLRSLSWNDPDYDDNVLEVIRHLSQIDISLLDKLEQYLKDGDISDDAEYVSSMPSIRRIEFSPNVFQVPEGMVEEDLVAVMMPFQMEFDRVYDAINEACTLSHLKCKRADEIWDNSTVIQDIFSLIFRSTIVVVDFTGKNPNVMYETGIAHTLGKHVIPITRTKSDIPFDLSPHRYLEYLNNEEGLSSFRTKLQARLRKLSKRSN